MKQIFIIIIALLFLSGIAFGQDYYRVGASRTKKATQKNKNDRKQGYGTSWDNNNSYSKPYQHDAYGPGVHSDATGKPFEWETENGESSQSNKVKPDGYGLGVGMDEYGRPVKPSPWGE